MRRVTIEWSYPMDIDNILLDERMQDIGIYYITRKFGNNVSNLYIGKIIYSFGSRLESHSGFGQIITEEEKKLGLEQL